MKNFLLSFLFSSVVLTGIFSPMLYAADPKPATSSCTLLQSGPLGIPTWYKYLPGKLEYGKCTGIDLSSADVNQVNKLWLIGIAVVEILLYISGILAFIFLIIGGTKFILAQGNPDKINNARQTILYSLVGAVIAILAVQIVAFIGRSIG